MTEEEKAAQKAKPVATTPIPGTPWYVMILPSEHFIDIPFPVIHCRRFGGDEQMPNGLNHSMPALISNPSIDDRNFRMCEKTCGKFHH